MGCQFCDMDGWIYMQMPDGLRHVTACVDCNPKGEGELDLPEDRLEIVRKYHARTGLYLGVKVCCLKCSYKFDSAMGECPICHSVIVPFPAVLPELP